MTRSVKVSQPLPAWEAGEPGATVRTLLRRSTPRSAQACEIAVRGHGLAEIGAELGEDVAERGWWRHACRDGEAEAHRLAAAVVGILAQDDDAHGVERRQPERVEDESTRRIEALGRHRSRRRETPAAPALKGFRARRRRPRASSRPSAASRRDHTLAIPQFPSTVGTLSDANRAVPEAKTRFPHPFQAG